jgi:carbon monoxide dehydrogenase subunit G
MVARNGVGAVEVAGEVRLGLAPEDAKALLRDPAAVAGLLGAAALEPAGPGCWRGTVTVVGLGPRGVRHEVTVRVVEGGGGVAWLVEEGGHPSGIALRLDLDLRPEGDGTNLRYAVTGHWGGLGGLLAPGSIRRAVQDLAQRLASR